MSSNRHWKFHANIIHVFSIWCLDIQYIPRNMHMVFALLCFVVVIYWLIFPYPSGLLHWHCGNLTIVPVPAKQPWWIWINTSCEFIMNDCITTTKQSTTKPCAYFLGYTVFRCNYYKVQTGMCSERCLILKLWLLWIKDKWRNQQMRKYDPLSSLSLWLKASSTIHRKWDHNIRLIFALIFSKL